MTNEEAYKATAIKTWKTVTARLEKLLSSLSDDDLQLEVAPGRNRVYYVLGHLAAHHDRLLPMLNIGGRLHSDLDDVFITNPDRTFPEDEYSGAELRKMLTEVNSAVLAGVEAMSPVDLLKRHADVSEGDFAKDTLRSRLAVFESRTAHVMFHAGQIRLVVRP